MDAKKTSSVADLLLLVVAAIWGSSYALAKQATLLVPVLQFIALRFGLTFLILLPALRPLLGRGGRAGLAPAGLLARICSRSSCARPSVSRSPAPATPRS